MAGRTGLALEAFMPLIFSPVGFLRNTCANERADQVQAPAARRVLGRADVR
jgi:hypothetical protein